MITWYGDKFLKDLNVQLASNTDKAAQFGLERLHDYVAEVTKTGELQASLYSSVADGVARVGSSSDHALFVEFGTSTQTAKPFLRRLLVADGDRLGSIMCTGG